MDPKDIKMLEELYEEDQEPPPFIEPATLHSKDSDSASEKEAANENDDDSDDGW